MKKVFQRQPLASGISAALLTLGLGVSAVQAQTADESGDQQQLEETAAEAQEEAAETDGFDQNVERMVVTGSRIESDSTLNSQSPVVSLGGEEIRSSGEIDVAALLRESPQLQASLPASFSAFNGTPLGASLLNLRNLGSVRTLVLEDGRRHVAGIEGTSSVDVNTISTALLRNVEVLTGGASSIYGADAVTGVVNFIMRDGASFDGMEIRTQGGITDDGDAEEFFLSLANGFDLDDGRGSMVFAAEYQQTEPIFAGDRDFAGAGRRFLVPNGPALEAAFGVDPRFSNAFIPDLRLPISSDGGIIAIGDGGASAFVEAIISGGVPGCDTIGEAAIPTCQIFDNGTLRRYNPGDVFVDGFNASGGDGVPAEPDDEILLPDTERFLFQAAFDYEVHPNVNVFADGKFVLSETRESNQVNGFNDDIPLALDNPFIPDALRGQIETLRAEGLDPAIVVSRDVLDTTARSNPLAERKTFRGVLGVEGEIPGMDLNYEVAFVYGRTDADITSRDRIEDRYFAAIDAVIDPETGEIVCRSDIDSGALVPPSSPFPGQNSNFQISTFEPGDGQCVPVNILGFDTISQEAADFIFQPQTFTNDIDQQVVTATLSGDSEQWFSLPAGPIGFAGGFEYRKETSEFQPGGFSASGLTFGTIGSNGGPTNPSSGEIEVSEYFAEARIPVLSGLPLIEELEFNGAYRFSDYETFGSTDTWSLGGRWTMVPSMTIRGTVSRSVRIPNIGEAFSPTFTAFLGADADPCNPQFIEGGSEFRRENCIELVGPVGDGPDAFNSTDFVSARIPGQSGGNPNLDPEEADTFTVGGVYRPMGDFGGLLDGLVVTVDYYKIEIDGLIDTLGGFEIAANCVDAPTLNNQFCEAIDRDPEFGFITGFQSGFINLAAVETSGIDWRVDYSMDVPDFLGGPEFGELGFSSLGTRFLTNDETRDVSAPNEITDVLGELSRPEWIVNLNANWTLDRFRIGWNGRFESSQRATGITNNDIKNDPDFANIRNTGSSIVHDFTASYFFTDRIELYGGINNAFEEEPFIGALSRPVGPRGRFFFAGLNLTL
ncbi:MAG: TonB-dependent receptor [Wenzhouxiangellaceae bacterium]|nr:TonB-dependent receptor [Wenzhouxiangellaceae bacterium]